MYEYISLFMLVFMLVFHVDYYSNANFDFIYIMPIRYIYKLLLYYSYSIFFYTDKNNIKLSNINNNRYNYVIYKFILYCNYLMMIMRNNKKKKEKKYGNYFPFPELEKVLFNSKLSSKAISLFISKTLFNF